MIDPHAAEVLSVLQADAKPMPADEAEWLAGYRAQVDGFVRFQGSPPDVAVADTTIEGPAGPLTLRVYGDKGQDGPVALFCHGGGFVAGSLAGYDTPLRQLAIRSGWRVVAINYRLAPESPYPAAIEDCWAALAHLVSGKVSTPASLAVIGDSAGGLLASVISRRARDADVDLALQILLYPNADLREASRYPSRVEHDGVLIRVDELYRSLALYAAEADRSDSDLSPVCAADLAGLCPAVVVTNENDPLRDEGEVYVRLMKNAGVPVVHERLPGMIHAGLQLAGAIPAGDTLITRVAEHLKQAAARRMRA